MRALLARVAELERERDEARARAAAVYEDAAQTVDDANSLFAPLAEAVRALASDTERDALERVRRAVSERFARLADTEASHCEEMRLANPDDNAAWLWARQTAENIAAAIRGDDDA